MDRLNTELRSEAIKLGLCERWQKDWSADKDPKELIDMWKRGIDFALLHDWPSNDFIKANFDRELLHENLIFVDEHINLEKAPSGVYVINGECTGTIRFSLWAAATIYVRHNSNLTVIADDFAKVFVRLYDEADAEVVELDAAVVKIYDRRG